MFNLGKEVTVTVAEKALESLEAELSQVPWNTSQDCIWHKTPKKITVTQQQSQWQVQSEKRQNTFIT